MQQGFLPISKEEMKQRGWDQVDFVYVSGDAYVDTLLLGTQLLREF